MQGLADDFGIHGRVQLWWSARLCCMRIDFPWVVLQLWQVRTKRVRERLGRKEYRPCLGFARPQYECVDVQRLFAHRGLFCRINRFASRAWRPSPSGHDSCPDFPRQRALFGWSFTDFGDRYVIRRRSRLSDRRLYQPANRHAPADCGHRWSPRGSHHCGISSRRHDCYHLWSDPALPLLYDVPAQGGIGCRQFVRSDCGVFEDGRELVGSPRVESLPGVQCDRRVFRHIDCGKSLRIAPHWLQRHKGTCDGPTYAVAVEGFNDN